MHSLAWYEDEYLNEDYERYLEDEENLKRLAMEREEKENNDNGCICSVGCLDCLGMSIRDFI